MSLPTTKEFLEKKRLEGSAPLFSEFYPLSLDQFNQILGANLEKRDYMRAIPFHTYMANSLAGVLEFSYFPNISTARIMHSTNDLYDLDLTYSEDSRREAKEQMLIRATKIKDLESILDLAQISRRAVKYLKSQQEQLGVNLGPMMDVWQNAGYSQVYRDFDENSWLVKIVCLIGDGDVPLTNFM